MDREASAKLNELRTKLQGLKRTDDQTDLHMALVHRIPSVLIIKLIQTMDIDQLNQADSNNRRAIDYLLDWEDDSYKILQAFIARGVSMSEGRRSSGHNANHPLVRICRRTVDGCQMLKLVNIPHGLKKKMLEEATKGGSCSTVKYLLDTGGNAKDTSIKYLLHTAAKSNHESLDKVRLLTSAGLDVSQTNAEGMTLLHVAADGKPPNIEMLLFTLNKGVDPNKQDAKRDTALHKVTKNYSERKITWTKSTQAMIHLLQHPNVDMNIKNAQGLTPLEILMSAKSRLPDSLLSMWLEKGAKIFTDATGGSHESRVKKSGLKTSLVDWSRRPDGNNLIKILIPHLESDKPVLQGYLNDMLEAAVADGSADTVGTLLDSGDRAGASINTGNLMMIAARSEISPDKKLCHLSKFGVDRMPKDKLHAVAHVLHAVAQSSADTERVREVLKWCRSEGGRLEASSKDSDGNTPLHLAANNTHPCSEVLVEELSREKYGGDPSARNKKHKNALQIVLQSSHSDKELQRKKIILLLKNGYKPNKEDFEDYKGDAGEFRKLFLHNELYTNLRSRITFRFLLVLAEHCQGQSKTSDWTTSRQWRDVSDEAEDVAVSMINELGKSRKGSEVWEMISHCFKEVDDGRLEWNKFVANKNVGHTLESKFYDKDGDKNGESALTPTSWKLLYLLPWFIVRFLFLCLILSFFIPMTCCPLKCRDPIKKLFVDSRKRPVVTFFSYMVSYIAFLAVLIAHIVDQSPQQVSWFDYIMPTYLVAMIVEEFYQMVKHKKRYKAISNVIDWATIVCFITFYMIRMVGNGTDNLTWYRVSEHFFAVAVALSFLRLLYFIQVIHKLGPILFSFEAIWAEVLSFVVILGIVLIAFGMAVTVVYHAGIYTVEFQNGTISLPRLVNGIRPTLKTMYWSLYGQVSYEDLDSEHDVLYPEAAFGLILFALWSMVSLIVLLNMLIALIDEAFDAVKKQNADLVWNSAIYHIIMDIEEAPSFPLPFNVFYIILSLTKPKWLEDKPDDTRSDKSPATDKAKQFFKKVDSQTASTESHGVSELIKGLQTELTEMSKGLKALRFQTRHRLSKQTKKVRACLRQVSLPGQDTDKPDGRFQDMNKSQPTIATDSDTDTDSDSDMDEDDQPKDRYERVSYTRNDSKPSRISLSYKNDRGRVGGCQFLSTPTSTTFNYFEIKIVDYGKTGSIAIGFARSYFPLNRMPGFMKGSIAYHCDSGRVFFGEGSGTSIVSPAQQGDTIGCGIKWYSADTDDRPVIFFTRNGEGLGNKRMRVPKSGFFPIVALRSQSEAVEVNLDAKWKSPEGVESPEHIEDGETLWRGVYPKLTSLPLTSAKWVHSTIGTYSTRAHESITKPFPEATFQLGRDIVPAIEDVHFSDDTGLQLLPIAATTATEGDDEKETSNKQTTHANDNRSERVDVQGNIISYGSRKGRVGVYQCRRRMTEEFSYYEVTINDLGKESIITVGLARQDYPLDQHPGWHDGSVAWHCDDAGLYSEYGLPCKVLDTLPTKGDRIGCGIGKWHSSESEGLANEIEVYFTHNGHRVFEETLDEPDGGLFPTVGMQSQGEQVTIDLSCSVPQKIRSERVKIEGDDISFDLNRYDEVGGVQLLGKSMDELKYFEVKILSPGRRCAIGIGIAGEDYPLDCQPGWCDNSIAYHCDDGRIFKDGDVVNDETKIPSSSKYIIGCGMRDNDKQESTVFFTRNGEKIHEMPFEGQNSATFYPTICMHSPGEKVKINTDVSWNQSVERLFSRWGSIDIDDNKASYVPSDLTSTDVAALQLNDDFSKTNSPNPYFEIEITCFGEDGAIGIGLAPGDYPLDNEPGWLPGSIGYHCDDGRLYEGVGRGRRIHDPGWQGHKLGCGISNLNEKGGKVTVFFTHNDEKLPENYELKLPKQGGLFPTIGMASSGEVITVIKEAKWPR